MIHYITLLVFIQEQRNLITNHIHNHTIYVQLGNQLRTSTHFEFLLMVTRLYSTVKPYDYACIYIHHVQV